MGNRRKMPGSPPRFERTLADLEDWANKTAIEDCKVDACLDRFLVRVHRLNHSIISQLDWNRDNDRRDYGDIGPKKPPTPLRWKKKGAEELLEIASELRDNLNRLVPGYVEENTDVLANEKVLRRLHRRYRAVQTKMSEDEEDEDKEDEHEDNKEQTFQKNFIDDEDYEESEAMETDDMETDDTDAESTDAAGTDGGESDEEETDGETGAEEIDAEGTETKDRPEEKLKGDVRETKGRPITRARFIDRLLDTLSATRLAAAGGKSTGASSLATGAFTQACQQLREAIDSETSSASFACGGRIPITSPIGSEQSAAGPTSPRVQMVHWGAEHDSTAHRFTLPVPSEASGSSFRGVQGLVDACQPASFGRGGQDILDPEYRRAGKLEPDQFLTSFHPADFGIIELIEQILLPGISSHTENCLQFRKLKAELYKLNVYSGPSGHFRKHVDTPRSEHQIGSLVVCLPCQFAGGNLTVQHHGQETNFDWSRQSSSSIQWAAFYSDCEHEIETVSSGHRITLTYNLYVREMPGAILAPIRPVLDPQTLPLYGLIKSLLTTPGFLKDGGVLGVFCSHAYPHSSELAELQLPRALKGADLVVYAVFEALGIPVRILPVLGRYGVYVGNDEPRLMDSEEDSVTGASSSDSESEYGYRSRRSHRRSVPQKYLKKGKEGPLSYREMYPWKASSALDVDQHWRRLLLTREVVEMTEAFSLGDKHQLPKKPNSLYEAGAAYVAPRFPSYFTDERGEDEDEKKVVNDLWPSYHLPGIIWLTGPKHEEMAFSHISYGNQASIGTHYSCAAILAVIPPFSQRGQSMQME
ncbi:hypothetical protein ASPBRDRAFT_78662 [Aspergillus brasiliensis CBS 101740]|uniref:Fe2OG dioxygenase domain-containing protein n=1 Tax=Aspergillus brasiliensis (strain CBS 101740 / IMI 381727 / IBT 21946) TaxID=767769 RepID=A0A1L9U625_ASPBC|nr:hypothetical protein ASPBRDRAFT_78662 [Aspergillus brasiliensis CBS 101740]